MKGLIPVFRCPQPQCSPDSTLFTVEVFAGLIESIGACQSALIRCPFHFRASEIYGG